MSPLSPLPHSKRPLGWRRIGSWRRRSDQPLKGWSYTTAPGGADVFPNDAGTRSRHVAEPAPLTRPPAIPGAGSSSLDSAAPTLASSLAANGGGTLAGEPKVAPGPFIPPKAA